MIENNFKLLIALNVICSNIEPKLATLHLLVKMQLERVEWLFEIQVQWVERHADRKVESVLKAEVFRPNTHLLFNHSIKRTERLSTNDRLNHGSLLTREAPLLEHVKVRERIWRSEVPNKTRSMLLQEFVNDLKVNLEFLVRLDSLFKLLIIVIHQLIDLSENS